MKTDAQMMADVARAEDGQPQSRREYAEKIRRALERVSRSRVELSEDRHWKEGEEPERYTLRFYADADGRDREPDTALALLMNAHHTRGRARVYWLAPRNPRQSGRGTGNANFLRLSPDDVGFTMAKTPQVAAGDIMRRIYQRALNATAEALRQIQHDNEADDRTDEATAAIADALGGEAKKGVHDRHDDPRRVAERGRYSDNEIITEIAVSPGGRSASATIRNLSPAAARALAAALRDLYDRPELRREDR